MDIVDWDMFTMYRWFRDYERVVYRRLVMERSEEALVRLEQFIKTARKKRYKLTATKILRAKCVDDSDEHIKKDKTYFCSEIVASVYKNLSLLPQERSASSYMPVSFSQRKQLLLQQGACLEEEKLIEFE